jgi:thiol-disulfide isomerase/thioredoxin
MRTTTANRITTALSLATLVLAAGPQPLAAAPNDAQTNLLSHALQATDAEAAWSELQQSSHQPSFPAEWQTAAPSREEQAKFFVPYVLALEDRTKDFYTRFPKDSHALDAKLEEFEVTSVGVQLGATNQQARLDGVEKLLLSDPNLTEKQRFNLRQNDVERAAQARESDGEAAVLAEYEKGIRVLQKEFPKQPEVLKMLLAVATSSEGDKARALLTEISISAASDQVKASATNQLKKLDAVGKPVALQFTAVDGREVDLAKMKGKVVLLDFWATWCGPCVGEVPHVVAAYDRLHPKGLEIVGISLDREKDSLTKFVAERKMEWPQFFDGQFWQNKYARQFGIEIIPAMWLIDKQGNLRDLNARSDLSGKVEKLLAE